MSDPRTRSSVVAAALCGWLSSLCACAPALEAGEVSQARDVIATMSWESVLLRGNHSLRLDSTRRSLYDLAHDPGELRPIHDENPALTDRLSEALRRELRSQLQTFAAFSDSQDRQVAIAPEELAELRALGYVDAQEPR
ncbi:MAG TPA: hypothetical protein VMT85_14055 [Thermoanaerobaculia bacterium]|nr:hypothetical protein [Thermoanaerobaculia bacterium]